MTRAEEVYAVTLNLLGSDPLIPAIQEAVDREHAAADPAFASRLEKRHTADPLVTM
jgi:hypothetical protein